MKFLEKLFKPRQEINIQDLAIMLKANRTDWGKGNGNAYWLSQAKVAEKYFRKIERLK